MAAKKTEPAAHVTTDTIDVARLQAANGVTFFVKFNRKLKSCGVTLGREFPTYHDDFVVSFDAMRAFVKLVTKYTGKGRR